MATLIYQRLCKRKKTVYQRQPNSIYPTRVGMIPLSTFGIGWFVRNLIHSPEQKNQLSQATSCWKQELKKISLLNQKMTAESWLLCFANIGNCNLMESLMIAFMSLKCYEADGVYWVLAENYLPDFRKASNNKANELYYPSRDGNNETNFTPVASYCSLFIKFSLVKQQQYTAH